MTDTTVVPLDPSKTDFEIRIHCVSLACGIANTTNGNADFAIDYARDFYLFLRGRDPLVDLNVTTEDNVIVLEEVRKGRALAEVDSDFTH